MIRPIPQNDVMEIKLDFCALLPKSHNPSVITRKTSDETQLRDGLQNLQPVLLKMSRSEKQETVPAKKSLRRRQDSMEWDSWSRKRVMGTTKGI